MGTIWDSFHSAGSLPDLIDKLNKDETEEERTSEKLWSIQEEISSGQVAVWLLIPFSKIAASSGVQSKLDNISNIWKEGSSGRDSSCVEAWCNIFIQEIGFGFIVIGSYRAMRQGTWCNLTWIHQSDNWPELLGSCGGVCKFLKKGLLNSQYES